jgi:redox-sensitive bicupin YhaK (pirin superfamily)
MQTPETKIRTVSLTTAGTPATDGAGVRLTRLIGTAELDHVDPFLLFDVFRTDNPDDHIAGFPPHPHRGFETVTYMLAGQMRHKDNAGNEGVIRAGGVQWMTAGRGIIHSEMPEQQNGLMWGTQLWVNLPGTQKMTDPGYEEFDAAAIPVETRANACRVKVIAGTTSAGTRGALTERSVDPLYLDVELSAEQRFREPVPASHQAFVFVVKGCLVIGGQIVAAGMLAVLAGGSLVDVASGDQDSHFLLIAGRELNEPVARAGPVVMSTQDELRRAFDDYRGGRF